MTNSSKVEPTTDNRKTKEHYLFSQPPLFLVTQLVDLVLPHG